MKQLYRIPTEAELVKIMNDGLNPLYTNAVTMHMNAGDIKIDRGVIDGFYKFALNMIGQDKLEIFQRAMLDGFKKVKAKHMHETHRPKKAKTHAQH